MTNPILSPAGWRTILLALAIIAIAVGPACSSQSPNIGKYYKGRILHVSIAAMERADELRWTTGLRRAGADPAAEQFYRLTPADPDNELVLLRVKVENHTATQAVVNLDDQSAQLRDFLQGRYFPIDVGERAAEIGVPERPADRCSFPVNPDLPAVCVQFLWNATYEEMLPDGQIALVQRAQQLPRGTGLDGWMVFEAPRNTQFRSFRWGSGDTITIDF